MLEPGCQEVSIPNLIPERKGFYFGWTHRCSEAGGETPSNGFLEQRSGFSCNSLHAQYLWTSGDTGHGEQRRTPPLSFLCSKGERHLQNQPHLRGGAWGRGGWADSASTGSHH